MAANKIERIANYSVALIALTALIVSVWQVKLFQSHNKLTVKPYLDASVLQKDSILVISFSNKGLGPAIIKNMNYKINGKEYSTIFELLTKVGEQENIISTYNYQKNSILSSGERKIIAELNKTNFRGIKIRIEYMSIYEESQKIEFNF